PVDEHEASRNGGRDGERRERVEVPAARGGQARKDPRGTLGVGALERRALPRVQQVRVRALEGADQRGIVAAAPARLAVLVRPRQPEAQHLERRRVAAEAHDGAHAVPDARIRRGEERRARAHAHAEHDRRPRARRQRRPHHGNVVLAQAAAREPRDRRHEDLEPGTGEQRRGLPGARIVLAVGRHAVDQHERLASAEERRPVAIELDARDGEPLARGRPGERGQRRQPALAQELEEEGARDQHGVAIPGGGGDEDEGEEESGESGYFRLTHFTRRHPLNMLTRAKSSGSRPTCARSGLSARFDFQPRRVQTGATRSSSQPMTRRSLRKWFRMTRTPPGFTTRRISRRTATGSGTAEIVYVATALSNSSSSKSMDVASMTLSVTFGIASVCTRSTALSSISSDRSIPVRRDAGG